MVNDPVYRVMPRAVSPQIIKGNCSLLRFLVQCANTD